MPKTAYTCTVLDLTDDLERTMGRIREIPFQTKQVYAWSRDREVLGQIVVEVAEGIVRGGCVNAVVDPPRQ